MPEDQTRSRAGTDAGTGTNDAHGHADVTPEASPHDLVGGGVAVAAIVDRFYTLMDGEAAYADLRALHAEDLSQVREGLTQFLDAWLGGPKDWFARGKCVMSLHRDIAISRAVADQWADAMRRAIEEQREADPDIAALMTERLAEMARAMVNRSAVASAA